MPENIDISRILHQVAQKLLCAIGDKHKSEEIMEIMNTM